MKKLCFIIVMLVMCSAYTGNNITLRLLREQLTDKEKDLFSLCSQRCNLENILITNACKYVKSTRLISQGGVIEVWVGSRFLARKVETAELLQSDLFCFIDEYDASKQIIFKLKKAILNSGEVILNLSK